MTAEMLIYPTDEDLREWRNLWVILALYRKTMNEEFEHIDRQSRYNKISEGQR
jgi:hypothetical protein